MIFYILAVTAIGGAIVADHYQTHIIEHSKKKFGELKERIVKEYKFRTRDKLAGLRAMDEFDNMLNESFDNITKGKLKDSMAKIKESLERDMETLRKDARRAGVEPAFPWPRTTTTTVRKRTTVKRRAK